MTLGLTLACFATAVPAAVPLGVTHPFDTAPPATDWTGANITGGGSDITTTDQLDAAVNAATNAASRITTALPTDSNTTPATHGSGAYWSSVLQAPFTRPTGISVMLMMAVLTNNTASAVNTLVISYDLISGDYTTEEIPGLRVYYSLTGAASSWTVITELSVFNSVVASNQLSATITLSGALAPGGTLYLLWADDNGNGQTDGWNALDNFLARSGDGAPTVTITSPTNNAAFTEPVNLPITASASDSDGVARVEFFAGTSKLGEDTTAPYSLTWSNAPAGSYALTAVATDGIGLAATSAAVNITVVGSVTGTNLLIARNSIWKYLDDGSDQGTAWTAVGFDDSAWTNGPAQLGYGDDDEARVINFGPDSNNKYITYYFRRAFVLTNAAAYSSLNLWLLRDDGGVVYLNGTEIWRGGMPPGTITYTTLSDSGGADNLIDQGSASAGLLVNGTNVIAVEIHQNTGTSTDVSFDFELAGVLFNAPPVVFISSPANNAQFTAPTNITINATASDTDGSVAKVEFYQNAVLLGEDPTAPYSVTWNNVTLGSTYALRAVATDNYGTRATSAVVNVIVQGNLLPTVALTNPPNNSVFVVPTNLLLGAVAADPNGTVAKVEFFASGFKLGEDSSSPYGLSWTNTLPGSYVLTAVATDNEGASATSAPVNVVFVNPPPPGLFIPRGSTWAYLDDGSDQGEAWRGFGYDTSGWSNGPAQLGFGDGDEATVVRSTGTNGQRIITCYFRQAFSVSDPANFKSLNLRLQRDDGGVVYLNSNEVFRSNMPLPPTEILYSTLASAAISGADESAFYFINLPPSLLLPGLNLVAVEIHQAAASSSDISFDLELNGTNGLPTVAISNPQDNTVFAEPGSVTITVAATDSDGTVTNVQFFRDGTRVGADATVPFEYVWQNPPLGTYQWTAVATDNLGDSATSAVVHVFLVSSTAPTIASFVPPAGVVSNLTQVTVNFSEPVDGVDAADLLISGVPATSVTGSNATYTFAFPTPMEGTVRASWASAHGITDRENPPKPFDGTAAGETVQYTLVDTVPPVVTLIAPAPGATLKSLTQIEVTFSEPVGGVQDFDLLINSVPASKVSGSRNGPYVFEFTQPLTNGPVQVAWAASHGIHDFAVAQNAFGGGSWSYTLNTNQVETGVVINEIMYHPASENSAEEYIELYNTNSVAMNLTGWQITGGIDFTFPSATLPAGGYLVVAANVAAFAAKYPTVNNVVGGWRGQLSNREDDLRLRNALGNEVDSVHYASEGDWAVRQRGPVDNGSRGWEWFAPHDGFDVNTATGQTESNKSLELINPALPNDNGQNWAASVLAGGTPGQANTVFANNIAPLIYNVAHFPPVPGTNDGVTVTARVVDELTSGPTNVVLFSRNASTNYYPSLSPLPFTATRMYDDGAHNDGLAGDGIYAAVLPPQPSRTVIEFYVSATDALGAARNWPAAARLETGVFTNLANAHYQVDDENYTGGKPIYRLVCTASDLNEFDGMSDSSDAEMNATLITTDGVDTKIRYNVGYRNRGAGTRGRTPHNLRVNIPADRTWNNLTEINLNTQYTHAQLAGSIFSLQSGMPCAAVRAVQVRMNGNNRANAGSPQYGHYVFVEPISGEWAAAHFPDDSGGNCYRGSIYPWYANLRYRGTDYRTYLGEGYTKTSNQGQNDWTDLFNLTYALSDTNSATYVPGVRQNANVELFMRFFAVCTALDYMETAMCRGVGDDYAMYRGLKDPRFLLIPHDFDTILGEGDTGGDPNRTIWNMIENPLTTDPAQRATFLFTFMRHPEFAPVYFRELLRLCDATLSAEQFNPMIDRLLGGWVSANRISSMKAFAASRNAYIRSQIPLNLTISHSLTLLNGYLNTPTPVVTLSGQANAIETRSVLVAGLPAQWTAWQASWTSDVTLQPGINHVEVQALDADGREFERGALDIWYDDGSVANVSGTISGAVTWTAANGPYNVTANISVGAGATLTIEPGTTVYFASGRGINVSGSGRLLAEGTEAQHIRFTRAPGSSVTWASLNLSSTTLETRLSYVDFEYSGSSGQSVNANNSILYLDHVTFANVTAPHLILNNSSFLVRDCVFSSLSGVDLIQGVGLPPAGYGIFEGNTFGTTTGLNDIIEFTGGQRPSAILQILNNVFSAASDDHLDLDGTDAHIEGNIFMGAHQGAPGDPDTASAISGGQDSGNTSELTIVRNLFYDCDHAVLAKQGNFYRLENNTIVHMTIAVVNFNEPLRVGTTPGLGAYLDGNIIWDTPRLLANYTNGSQFVTINRCILPPGIQPTNWPGTGNLFADPMLVNTNVTSYLTISNDFALQPGSPAIGTGPNGLDIGAEVPGWASITGEPWSPTPGTTATLTVGGPGVVAYRYKVNSGAYGAETSVSNALALAGLTNGSYDVSVIGKNSAGVWQELARPTVSRTWVVNSTVSAVRITEVLASNQRAVPVGSAPDVKYPDLIELYNSGPSAVDLYGSSITDNKDEPRKYIFPPGTTLAAGQYLVLYADNDSSPPGLHTGFTLKLEGDDLYLFSTQGQLLDLVVYGPQVTDLSIGRLADGQWALTQPTFGAPNVAARTGDYRTLKINEWLAAGFSQGTEDFIELFNPDPLPVNLSGLFLSDTPESRQNLEEIAALSFIAGGGYSVFLPDGDPGAGPDHLDFRLAAEQGQIGLFAADLSVIDWISYGPQTNSVSEGRSPNGSTNIIAFAAPSPGAPNPLAEVPFGTTILLNEILAKNIGVSVTNLFGTNLAGATPAWIELFNPTSNAVSLADMSLSDGSQPHNPRKYVFPAGVTIPARGYYVILCDGSAPASPTNTGFGIKANGDLIYLYDKPANGGSRLDLVDYGVQAKDYSIGRVPLGGSNWVLTLPSARAANVAATLGDPFQLRLNEWMADPASGDDWLELYNPSPQPVALGGLYLTDNLAINSHTKSPIWPLSFIGTELYGYEKFIADGNPANGHEHVAFALSKGGESLGLFVTTNVPIDALTFGAQALGVSEGRLPDGAAPRVRFTTTPTPGDANYLPLTNVVVNEVLSHSALPLEDAIELHNESSAPVNVTGWYLSDALRTLKKFQITNTTIIPAGGYKVFYEYQLNPNPDDFRSFSLDSTRGDEVYLSAVSTNGTLNGYRAEAEFGAAAAGVSFGRYTNSVGEVHFVAQSRRTFGQDNPDSVAEFRLGTGLPNAAPQVGPVVISELMYHPLNVGGVEPLLEEFIELHNFTSTNVPLYDPVRPTNGWRLRDAVSYQFAAPAALGPGDYLLVVSFDPVLDTNSLATFRAKYGLSSGVPIYGPYTGRLDNGGESVELCQPDVPPTSGPDQGYVPEVLVERVKYSDAWPWDPAADGTGNSLQRRNLDEYGNDPANWAAAVPTPGPAGVQDRDGDGMPDAWEVSYGLNPNVNDALGDLDGDGMVNIDEYYAGTLPNDPLSNMKLEILNSGSVLLRFTAMPEKAYTIEYRDTLTAGDWQPLYLIPAESFMRIEQRLDLPPGNTRFYRLRTP